MVTVNVTLTVFSGIPIDFWEILFMAFWNDLLLSSEFNIFFPWSRAGFVIRCSMG